MNKIINHKKTLVKMERIVGWTNLESIMKWKKSTSKILFQIIQYFIYKEHYLY